MEHLLVLREKHGPVYATQLADGRVVPWRPLSIGEFLEYDNTFRRGVYPQAYLEDEIFNKCVLDKYLAENPPGNKAGDITTVVSGIMLISGPTSLQEMQNLLMMKRLESSGIIHQIVSVITRAYPAYTPDAVYNMDYQSLMLRFAQAENKLLEQGMITEQMSLEPLGQSEGQEQPQNTNQMLEKYYEQQGATHPSSEPLYPPLPPRSLVQTIVSDSDMAGMSMGADMEDKSMLETKMVNEAADIYGDYLEQIRKGEKLRIKTPAEREAEARVRMEENKKRVQALATHKNQKEKEYEAKVAKMLETRARKKRRR